MSILKNTTYVALVIHVAKLLVAQCNTRTLHVISQKWAMCYRKIGLSDIDTRHVCSNIFNTWWNSNIKLICFHQLKEYTGSERIIASEPENT